ncbi:MAG: 4-hydroxy-3-methylbut-2-enyl diphosphate reductase [Endomicrobium sp.]|jgi:4-hydroxy-3-methylbut-2-enyl diphosphate reductase|nr:4-hydroxy-3-methylbut-2-enyl diphosphate reductase [Endomicrobium sp.]
MFKIKITDNAGFCFGVERAINLIEKVINKNREVYTIGPIIHNPQEVERLEKKNVKVLTDIDKIKNCFLILRTHGIPYLLYKKLRKNKSINIIDATCPFVKKTQKIISRLGNSIKSKNEMIIIIGERSHPEIIALMSYNKSCSKCVVIESIVEAQNFNDKCCKLNVITQTTQTLENFENIIKILKKRYKIKAYNTICKTTFERQKSAKDLAKCVDLMIVIGGKNSSNTMKLFKACSLNTSTYHIETEKELKKKWLLNVKKIGLTAGTSTPYWIIKRVEKKIKTLLN